MEAVPAKTKAELWWDWTSTTPKHYPKDDASDDVKKDYLDELLSRCLLIDSLLPAVTAKILVMAFDQFVPVQAVKFLKPPLPHNQCTGLAIIELEKPEHAKVLETLLVDSLIMIGGLPRPARGQSATASMLMDHPCRTRSKKCVVMLVSKDDEDAAAKCRLFEQQDLEASYLHELQRAREEALANEQETEYLELKRNLELMTETRDHVALREIYRNHNVNLANQSD